VLKDFPNRRPFARQPIHKSDRGPPFARKHHSADRPEPSKRRIRIDKPKTPNLGLDVVTRAFRVGEPNNVERRQKRADGIVRLGIGRVAPGRLELKNYDDGRTVPHHDTNAIEARPDTPKAHRQLRSDWTDPGGFQRQQRIACVHLGSVTLGWNGARIDTLLERMVRLAPNGQRILAPRLGAAAAVPRSESDVLPKLFGNKPGRAVRTAKRDPGIYRRTG
jgi:hypothetical protein